MSLKSRIPEIAAAIPRKVHEAERIGVVPVKDDAQRRVPQETGRLHDSIHVELGAAGEVFVIAGNEKVFYGHLVEHGHATVNGGQVPPHPFLVPAFEENREAILAAIRVGIAEAAKAG